MTAFLKTNEYSISLRRLDDEQLREYITKPENYQNDAILAAIWELEHRRPLRKDEIALEAEISGRAGNSEVSIPNTSISEFKIEESKIPSLYSVRSIHVFSVLFSVLAGGILMAINFSRTTQKAEAIKVLGFSVGYTFISILILAIPGTQSPVISLILNLLGAYLIYELFWKRVLGNEFRFKKQQVWTTLIIALIIISPLVWWYITQSGALQTM
jgi:hypothetical protein